MAIYQYQSVGLDIPPIPILRVQIFQPGNARSAQFSMSCILDTGSDCTLLPLSVLMSAKGKPVQGMRRIPVCGTEVVGIPTMVGLMFGQHELARTRVYGVPGEEIGDLGLIGRDILNQFKIEFNGPELFFEIH